MSVIAPRFRTLALALVASGLALCPAAEGASTYSLVWSDEFDGTTVDTSKWTFQIGDGCPSLCAWGNNELQYYRSQNATVSGGLLTITAKQENFGGRAYTSARMITKDKGDWTYGRMEMRARLPIGQGIWPAFWMLFSDPTYGGWAASGELDIMEYIGQNPNQVLGTIHYGGPFPGNVYSGNTYTLPSGNFNQAFHTFSVEWEPGEIRWYVDGTLYAAKNDWYSTGGAYPAPFNQDFHILLNMAVGGNLPGNPNGSTVFPQEFIVDYVRVYQKETVEGCNVVYAGMEDSNPYANGWFSFNGIGGGGVGSSYGNVAPVGGAARSLNVGWGSGGSPGYFGGFGRENVRDLTGMTHFSFWINPNPGQDYTLQVQLQDDDNGNDNVGSPPDGTDDEFQFNVTVKPSGGMVVAGGGWQRVKIPLSSFFDDNSYHWGGNGILDPTPTSQGGNGQLINVVYTIISNSGADASFTTDRWEFTREDAQTSGVIWGDSNGNGVLDGAETGVPSIVVNAYDPTGSLLGSTATNAGGSFAFSNLPPGDVRLEVVPSGVLIGAPPTADPDGVSTPDEACVVMVCNNTKANQNFGYMTAVTGVDPQTPGPVLLAGLPNPFASSTRIQFTLDEAGPAQLSIFSVSGRKVRTLENGSLDAGSHERTWNGTNDQGTPVADGMYLIVLETADGTRTQRTLKLR